MKVRREKSIVERHKGEEQSAEAVMRSQTNLEVRATRGSHEDERQIEGKVEK